MKQTIKIPNQRRYQPILKKKHKSQPKIERVRLGNVPELNHDWMARRINLSFILADIMEGLTIEVEEHMRKYDNNLSLDMRNSVERIKIHTRNLVSFVDKNTDEEFSEQFGNRSDEIKEYLFNKMGIV